MNIPEIEYLKISHFTATLDKVIEICVHNSVFVNDVYIIDVDLGIKFYTREQYNIYFKLTNLSKDQQNQLITLQKKLIKKIKKEFLCGSSTKK